MASKEQIAKWKDQYGRVFRIIIEGTDYIYRRPNVGEMLSLRSVSDENKVSSYVMDCILEPEDKNDITPGIYNTLRDNIVDSIKLESDEDLKAAIISAQKRVEIYLNDAFFVWRTYIMKAFPGYTFEDLDSLQVDDFFDLLILTEHELGTPIINYKHINRVTNGKFKNQQNNTPPEYETPGRKPKFLPQDELNMISIEASTKELNEQYRSDIPVHQTGKSIRKKEWKDIDVKSPGKKKFSPPPNLMKTRNK